MEIEPGTIIDDYLVLRVLSESSVATTFVAARRSSQSKVLLKVARESWDTQFGSYGFRIEPGVARAWRLPPSEMLQRELLMLADLADSNLPLPVPLAAGTFNNTPYTVFSYFEGETLESYIASGCEITVTMLAEICRAVYKLQSVGLFHGNLSPSTIVVSANGVLLLDATLPYTEYLDDPSKDVQACVTNPSYYPLLDPRQDQLAIGILLYYLFTRVHPLVPQPLVSGLRQKAETGSRMRTLLNTARIRGANRYFRPLLELMNPTELVPNMSLALEDLIFQAVGVWRMEGLSGQIMVDVIPDGLLDPTIDPSVGDEELCTLWQVAETLERLAGTVRAKMVEESPPVEQLLVSLAA
jgi:serine/threonine protein kinase